jgi:hypothetical protein
MVPYSRYRLSLGLVIAAAILIAQFGNSALQHLGNTRYFAWAPNDYMVTYDLQVSVAGRSLNAEEIASRYRLDLRDRLPPELKMRLGLSQSEHYVWEDPPQHLFDRIKWYEQSYGVAPPARVNLTYQLDAGQVREWRWPA